MVTAIKNIMAKKKGNEVTVDEIARDMKKCGRIEVGRIPREFAATMRKIKINGKQKVSAVG